MRARWAELRVQELEARARAREAAAPSDAHDLWQRVLCLAPEHVAARAGVVRTQPVRVHRPRVEVGESEAREGRDAYAGLAGTLEVAGRRERGRVDPELALRWRAEARAKLLAEIDALMSHTEAQLRAARFDAALEGASEVRQRLGEMRRADDLPPRWAQLEVLEATALVAMGRETEARASLVRALAADPDLALDPGVTPPKLLRALDAARNGH